MTSTPERNESTLVWLVSDGRVLASARRAVTRTDRRRGLMGVTSIPEPLVLEPCSWIHTLGMRTSIDVVYVAADGIILSTSHMRPWRVGPLTRHAHVVVEAAPGSIERWNVKPGDKLEIRNVES